MPRGDKKTGDRGTKADGTPRFTKANLPSKDCITCGRPFNWRKAWAKVWDDVKYCSDRCRAQKR
jgi:hypothetical protein